ncbi:Amino acid transporter [Pseudobutyrivibrio sp. NOR37]|uniref:Glutamate/gamma-aminobutyrate family transporter YjeM n=1 Tax=Pseudobutyrivibrio xylanivorans TaxID=185007 RepID=A0A6M0LH77_PSEXY|nr:MULTISPECIES: glutamate/gamma-aminobutyrate family transporter YjeM [Pseudobutyrivibrio]NEX01882.1 glutamate/gamma-aminobutyrate family transporter YjeM [Pseudobutyrivibrio xylanivorans]SFR72504.1 Amino acid transporter [Pseudobutyrivibrio sp. NOR37]
MKEKKLGLMSLILMIFTSVYGFNNIPRSYYLMGYAAIPWFVIAGILFFIPFAFMVAEFGSAFRNETGGMYSWMCKSVGPKYAFIGTFMWYTSYVLWMVNVSSGIWVPVSNVIFGKDTTATWSLFGSHFLSGSRLLGIMAVIFFIVITYFDSKGIDKISTVTSVGGTAVLTINIMVVIGSIIMIIARGGQLQQPFAGFESLKTPLNVAYQGSPIAILSFIVYALFAYGGIEAVGGLVDKTENPKKNFPKGIVIAALVIVVGYATLIMLVGSFTNYKQILGNDEITLGNVSYVIMSNFAAEIGKAFGATPATQLALAHGFARVYACIMLLALMGAMFTLVYSPLKQIIDGTPKELWPGKMGETAEGGMPKNAMWIQCTIVSVMILLISFGGDTMQQFFLILTAMVNVGMTVPYMFISFAFPKFKKMKDVDRSFVVFKSQASANIWGYVVTLTLLFANAFAIVQPALDGDVKTTFWSLSGPVIFGFAAWVIYTRYEKRLLAQGDGVSGSSEEVSEEPVAQTE